MQQVGFPLQFYDCYDSYDHHISHMEGISISLPVPLITQKVMHKENSGYSDSGGHFSLPQDEVAFCTASPWAVIEMKINIISDGLRVYRSHNDKINVS